MVTSTGIKICESRLYQSQIFLLKRLLSPFFVILRLSDFKGINFLLKLGEKEATILGFFVGLFFVFVFLSRGFISQFASVHYVHLDIQAPRSIINTNK